MKKAILTVAAIGAALALKADFEVGFARVDITPPIGTELSGHPEKRVSDGIIDPLEVNAVAFSDGTNRAVVISADVTNLRGYFKLYRENAAKAAGLPPEALFIALRTSEISEFPVLSEFSERLTTFSMLL